MPRPLPVSEAGSLGVFTTRTAYLQHWTPDALANAVRHDRLIRLARGVYVAAENWDGTGPEADRRRLAIRAVAAALAVEAVTVSHTSAAVVAQLPVWELPDRPCVTVLPRTTGDAGCAHLHRAGLPIEHVLPTPIPRTRTARTVLDIGREHGIDDAVVAGDAALRRGMTDPQELLAVAQFCANWPGIRRALRVLSLLDPRSESAVESVSRVRLRSTSLPVPEPQVEILARNGVLVGRLDFYWDAFGVAGEVDGKVKYRDNPEQALWREKRRQEHMEDLGLIFVRWGRADLDDLGRLAARIAAVLARGARRPQTDRDWVARPTEPRFPLLGDQVGAAFAPRISAVRRSQH